MPKWSREYWLPSLLAAVAAVLALALALEWAVLTRSGSRNAMASPAKTGPSAETGAEAGEEFALPGLDDFGDMVEHPLFMENRKPGAELTEPTAPPPPPTPMNLKLMGVVRTPSGDTALLMDGKGKYQRLQRNGLPLDGWTLVELGLDRVTLQQGDRREVLPLLKKRPKPPAGFPLAPVPGQPGQGQAIPRPPLAVQPPRPGPIPPNAVAGVPPQTPDDETDSDTVDEDTDSDTVVDENQ